MVAVRRCGSGSGAVLALGFFSGSIWEGERPKEQSEDRPHHWLAIGAQGTESDESRRLAHRFVFATRSVVNVSWPLAPADF